MTTFLYLLFWVGFLLVLFTTLAPLTSSAQWWIRGWDFPRVHIALAALLLAILGATFLRTETLIASAAMVVCATYQVVRIYPYTAFAETEIEFHPDVPEMAQITAIAANVLKENTDHAALVHLLERYNPDVLFLMETDQAWIDGLSDYLNGYKTVLRQPRDDHYGLVFASNLDVVSSEIVHIVDDATPAVLAELAGPTGNFYFVGLHPRPPVPGNTTAKRDAQIKRAAQLADRTILPVIAMGDFNDVAWSYTSQRFKEYGAFRDPRVGRSMLPSFDANSWIMRFPIDQLYLTEGLDLIMFDRLGAFGSDHFPIYARFAVNAD